jgi:hypothetical protein
MICPINQYTLNLICIIDRLVGSVEVAIPTEDKDWRFEVL